jgi:hypothetical protein
LQSAQAGLTGPDDRLHAIRDSELAEDVADMVGDGLGAEAQLLRNLGIGAALGDELEDFGFPVG